MADVAAGDAAAGAAGGPAASPTQVPSGKRRRLSESAGTAVEGDDDDVLGQTMSIDNDGGGEATATVTDPVTPPWHRAVIEALEPADRRNQLMFTVRAATDTPPYDQGAGVVSMTELEAMLPTDLTMPKWYSFQGAIIAHYAWTPDGITRYAFIRLSELLQSPTIAATTTMGFPCATLAKLALFTPTLCRDVATAITESLPRFNGNDCAEVALVMLTMFQRSSTTRMASEKAGLTEATIVTCAQVIAKPILGVLRKLIRGDLINLAKLRDLFFPPVGASMMPWPLQHVMDEVMYELRKAAELLYITARNQLFPILWVFRPPKLLWYLLDSRGFYRLTLLTPTYQTAEDKEYGVLLSTFARCLPPPMGAESPDALRMLLYQSQQVLFTGHFIRHPMALSPDQQAGPQLHQGLEDVLVDLVCELALHPPADKTAELRRWNFLCDVLFLKSVGGGVRHIHLSRFIRAVLTRMAREAPGRKSQRIVWLVLQLMFGDRNFLRDDWAQSLRTGQRSLFDALADMHAPIDPTTVATAERQPQPWLVVELAMACLMNRAILTAFLTASQGVTSKYGPSFESEMQLLSAYVEGTEPVFGPADAPSLTLRSFQKFVLAASAVSSEKVTAELFEHQCGKYGEGKTSRLRLSGGHSRVTMTPLPIEWIDEMPVWTRLRFQVFFLAAIAGSKGPMLAPAAIETFARITHSIPLTSSGNLANFFNSMLSLLQKDNKELERVQSRRAAVHLMLEILAFRMIHLLPYQKKPPMIWVGVLLECLRTTADRQLHAMLHCVFIKVLVVVYTPLFEATFSKIPAMIPKSDERLARMLIQCMCRSHRLSIQPLNPTAFVAVAAAVDAVIPLQWSVNAMRHFPKVLRDFYAEKSGDGAAAAISAVHMAMQDKVAAIAQDPLAQALYDPSLRLSWPDAKAMFTDDGNRHLFFCVVMYNMGKDPDLTRAFDVMKAIPLQELSTCVSRMTDYTTRVLNRTGEQFEAYLNYFMRMMEKLIWTYRFFTVDDVVLSLIREDPHEDGEAPKRMRLVQELLFATNSTQLKTLVGDFTTKMARAADTSRCQTWHEQHSEHIKANSEYYDKPFAYQLTSVDGNALPEYLGSLCLRVLPTFDRVVDWILDFDPHEADQASFMASMKSTFGGLFEHHLTPLSTLHSMLLSHHEILVTQPKVLRNLVLLYADLQPHLWEAHPRFRDYMEDRAVCSAEDVAKGILRALREVAADPTHDDCRYNEHLTSTLRAIRESAIRLLASPESVIPTALTLVVEGILEDPNPYTMNIFASLLLSVPLKHRCVLDSFITSVLEDEWCHGQYTPSASSSARFDARGASYPRVLCEFVHATVLPDQWQHELLPGRMLSFAAVLVKATSLQHVKFFVHCFGPYTPLFTLESREPVDHFLKILDCFAALPKALFTPHAGGSGAGCEPFDIGGVRSVLTYIRLFVAGVGTAAREHVAIQRFLESVELVLS